MKRREVVTRPRGVERLLGGQKYQQICRRQCSLLKYPEPSPRGMVRMGSIYP